jgi:hypothetical protein
MTAVAAPALGSSLQTITAAVPWCSFRLGLPPGAAVAGTNDPATLDGTRWVNCDAVLNDATFFTRWIKAVTTRMERSYPGVPKITPSGYIMGWYSGMFAHLGGMLFHRFRRVPALTPGCLAFRLGATHLRPVEVALLDPSFYCLPDDPAADHAGTTVLADPAALAAALRAEVARHGARFVEAYARASRFGRRTLWGAVTDAVDRGVWHLAHARTEFAAGAADAALVLPGATAPFTSASTIHTLRGPSGKVHWTRTRQSCCFYYKLPGVDTPCSTCPRVTDVERGRLLDAQG